MRRKRKELTDEDLDSEIALAELTCSEKYQLYLKEHTKRLRQLERELRGLNMENPPE